MNAFVVNIYEKIKENLFHTTFDVEEAMTGQMTDHDNFVSVSNGQLTFFVDISCSNFKRNSLRLL